MNQSVKNRLREILDTLHSLDYIRPDSVPDIDLYMDQITTFMDRELAASKRHPDDKVLTKTMINNYTKNDLLPPPKNKKYSKEQLLILIFIYYMKSFLSIGDIEKIIRPLTERFYGSEGSPNLEKIYSDIYDMEYEQTDAEAKEILEMYLKAQKTFPDAECSDEDRDVLHTFSFLCMLSFDIYVKKRIVEKIVDLSAEKEPSGKK